MSIYAQPSQSRRSPRKLLLAFLGEFLWLERRSQVRARAIIHALEGAGVTAPAIRAALVRNTQQGLLSSVKIGREVAYSLTPRAEQILHDAHSRVNSSHPFQPEGQGWSLVLFSLPEESQPTRHRLRSILTWEGFAPFGRGAWIAPGEVDFEALRHTTSHSVQADTVIAFRAHVADGYSMTAAVESTWNVHAIAAAHYKFAETWGVELESDLIEIESPLASRTMLIADWLELLRQDPRLPPQHLSEDWPADRSHELFLKWQKRLTMPSLQELHRILGE